MRHKSWFSTLAAGAFLASPAQAQTAADYAKLPFVEDVELSPSGDAMAGLFGVGGQRRICIIGFAEGQKPTCVGVPDMMEAGGIEWVNDTNILVHLTALAPVEGDRWYISRAIAIHRDTGKITKLLWDKNGQSADRVLWTARDGSPTAIISAQSSIYVGQDFWPAVYRVNVETGTASKIMGGYDDVMHWVTDGDGNVRMGYGYDDQSRKSRLMYRPANNVSFKIIDRADSRKREDVISPIGFGAAPDSGIVVHEDADHHSALFEVDLPTQKDLRKIWTAPEGSWIAGEWMDDDRKTVLAVRLQGKQRERIWLNPDLADLQAAFAKSVPSSRVHILSLSRNRQRMLVAIDRPDTPGSLYFFDMAAGTLQRIAYFAEALKANPLNPVRAVTYKARDGLEIEAIVTTPKGQEGKRLPVVVMPHGGPWAHDSLDYDYWPQFVASLGYLVIQPNFRGSTGYGDEFERKGEGQMGLAMQDDLNDALKWAVDTGVGDAKRACLVGASYGGYATMWGLVRDNDLWRCGISIAGVSNVRREVNDMSYASLTGESNRDAWKRMTPDFPAVSPIRFVDKIKAPLMLIHGKMDVTVEYGQSVSMAGKMKDAGKPVEFITLPKADHHFTREADRLVLLQSIEAFLKKNNPPN
jgi:dipeptidyl aminopeptidase/acylaminoacyl peptidase